MLTSRKEELTAKAEPKYPRLMIARNTGNVVLFTGDGVGTKVLRGFGEEIGFHCKMFNMSDFEIFYGTITLEQK